MSSFPPINLIGSPFLPAAAFRASFLSLMHILAGYEFAEEETAVKLQHHLDVDDLIFQDAWVISER